MEHPAANTHVLLIGIDAYTGGVPPLNGCVNDIDSMQRLLIDRLGVGRDFVKRLTSPKEGNTHESDVPAVPATRENLVSAFVHLGSEVVTENDRVFIYFSGHGASVPTRDEGVKTLREALVPVDAAIEEKGATGLLYDVELNRLLQRVMARTNQVTFVLDCCHSGGATRDLFGEPGDAVRAVHIDKVSAGPASAPTESTRAVGTTPAGTLDDCQIITACLADEKALECVDEHGNKHGLLTQTLVRALQALDPEELKTLPWGRIWRQVVGEVEGKRPQHPTLTGSFARPLFGGPPRAGDMGYGVKRAGDTYRLDVGDLSGVTIGALVAVYGSAPAMFPALNSPEDKASRVGLLKVTAAKRSNAAAEAVGAAFDLPQGARARLVEAGDAAKVRVSVPAGDAALEALVGTSTLLKLADVGETSAVQLVRDAEGVLTLTDALHGIEEPYIVKIPASEVKKTPALLDHYVRYSTPLRMSDACTDLPGALRLQFLNCNGRVNDEGYFEGDTQSPDLPEVPRGQDGVYEFAHDDLMCIRLTNTSTTKLKVSLFDCTPDGYAALLDDPVLEPRSSHVLWWNDEAGRALPMSVQAGRSVSLDRMVAIGTSAVEKSLRYLDMPPIDTFEGVLNGKGAGAPTSKYPAPERWTAARAILRTRAV